MAATNFTPIQLYHSTTAAAVPVSTNLTNGELAINITDGKLYYKDNGGTVQIIASKGTGTIGGSTTQVQYNNTGALAGSANFTFDGTTATINTLNLTNALGAAYGGTAQSTYAQGDLLYASAANTLAKLGIGISTYILTSNGTIPGWSAPSAVSIGTATNLAGGAAGSVPYQSGPGATTFLLIGTANQVITSSGSAPQWSSGLSITTLTASDAVTFSATTQNIALGTSQTSGTFTVGGAAQTGTQTIDQSTKTHTLNIGAGATESGATKTVNLATAGVSGSTTTMSVGSAVSGAITNLTVNATTTLAPVARSTGAVSYFTVTTPADTGLTASTEVIGSSFTAATRTWATGALTLQRERVFAAPTYAFAGASTLTTAVNVDIGLPVAGTNATITNAYALRADNTLFTGNVVLDNASAALDLTNLEVTNIKAKDGTASMTLADSTGVVTFSKATVIETTDNTNAALRITQLGTGNALLVEDSANPDSSPFVVTATGDVSIGTNSPVYKLTTNVTGASATALFKTDQSTADIYLQASGTSQTYSVGIGASGNGLRFLSNAASNMLLDSSGNLGLGVTPSGWASGSAIDIAGWASFAQRNTNGWTLVGGNVYWDGSNYKYKNSSTAALYELRGPTGVHAWLTAPSGTANSAVVAGSTSYTVVALGTTTLAEWQASFSGLSAIPTLGQVLTSLSSPVSPIPNGGLVTQNISFTQAMTLLANGNLGIGETNPSTILNLKQSTGPIVRLVRTSNRFELSADNDFMSLNARDASTYINFKTEDTERARISSDGTFRVKGAGTAGSTDAVQFSGSAPASTLILDSSGNLGVGTSSPSNRVQSRRDATTDANNSQFIAENRTGAVGQYTLYGSRLDDGAGAGFTPVAFGAVQTDAAGRKADFVIAVSDTDNIDLSTDIRARITSDGNLGIGTNAPAGRLSVKGSTSNSSANAFFVEDSSSAGIFRVRNDGDIYMGNGGKAILDSSGNLGLGVTPSAWESARKAIQLSGTASYFAANSVAVIAANNFFDGQNKYIGTDYATQYAQSAGQHIWLTAPSGTADGTAATSLTSAQNGNSYTIKVAGTTDFTLIGAANNNVGTTFTKSGGTGAGTGTVSQNISFTQAMTLDANGKLLLGVTSSTGLSNSDFAMVNGGSIRFRNAANSAYLNMINVDSSNNLNFGVGGVPAAITFGISGIGETARITSGGYFKASNNGTYNGAANSYHEFYNTANDEFDVWCQHASATTPKGIRVYYSAAAPNGTGNHFLYCDDTGGQRASIRSNGGLANYQSNNVDLSDIRTKTDISPLASYWNKIAALEIVTYKYKDQTHDDLNIGVIAQQVEQVAPEFVDPDGFGETPEDGVPLKTIYNKDLTFAAIKALQEAMARIEKLEAEVAALKGA